MIVEKVAQTNIVEKVNIDKAHLNNATQREIKQQRDGELKATSSENQKEKTQEKITLKEAVDKLNKALEIFNVERRFVIDPKTKEVVVKIIDKQTGKVIDQIPPEEALKRYYEMQKFIGLLFNKRV